MEDKTSFMVRDRIRFRPMDGTTGFFSVQNRDL
jgi:hypothetical protein